MAEPWGGRKMLLPKEKVNIYSFFGLMTVLGIFIVGGRCSSTRTPDTGETVF